MDLKTIPGLEGYLVDSQGNVWSTKPSRFKQHKGPHQMKAWTDGDGYKHVTLTLGKSRIKRYSVHRLVALAFHGVAPRDLEVCHLDGDRANNRSENLTYGTHRENIAHRDRMGRTCRGDRSHLAKVTDDQCLEMLKLIEQGVAIREIAARYSMSVPHVYGLKYGSIRKHLRTRPGGTQGGVSAGF